MTPRRHVDQGFSLLELLTALAIFAIIALIAQQGMFSAMKASEGIDRRSAELAELQLAVTLVTRDLQAIQPRTARTGADTVAAPLLLGDGGAALTFSRSGHSDPTGRPRAAFIRVSYAPTPQSDDRPARREWLSVDHPGAAVADRETLLDPLITALHFETYADGTWAENWPGEDSTAPLPDAVSVTFETQRWGDIVRIVTLK